MSQVSALDPPTENKSSLDATDPEKSGHELDRDSPIAARPDPKDEPIVTRRELWSYYLYFNGDNGVGPTGFSMTLFQSLATAAGYDPVKGPGSSCLSPDSSGRCVLPWAGGTKAVASVVLIANSISFSVMALIFTTIGSAADYGSFGRWVQLVVTCICWGAQFASMSLTVPSRWRAAMTLFMISFITYGATLVFFAAPFPRLARNTPHSRAIYEKYIAGEVTLEEYELEESLEKNRISNISQAHSFIGFIATLCLNLTLLLPLADNPLVNNYCLVLITGYWVIMGIWWFIFQQPRPGPPLPEGEHYLTIGWKQIWHALKQYKKLPHTFIYLFAFFLLSDAFNTTGTLVSICQNDKVSFSFLQTTYLQLAQAIGGTVGIFVFWYTQRRFKISTKRMFVVTNIFTVLIPFWGMLGIRTQKIGFHNVWEFWAYNVVFGLFQAPYYCYAQTMTGELSPPGYENMFFGLFGLSNRTSSMIGPNVIQAIINQTGNNWMGFPFLFALSVSASLVLWFAVDVTKGRRDAEKWARETRGRDSKIA